MIKSSNARTKILRARTDLVMEQPFFGALALSLPPVEDPTCKTAWVDGRRLGYNPTFIESLNNDECKALVAHEVEHVALGHPWRRDGRSMKNWNIACDKAINHDLRDAGFKLPNGALYAEGEEKGKSAEWIFARLPQPQPKPQGGGGGQQQPQQGAGSPQGPQQGSGTPQDGTGDGDAPDPLGEVRDAPTEPDADGTPAPSEQEWKQKTAAAAMHAKQQGKLPGSMQRAIADALKPRIDVRSLLLRFFSERAASDYSWSQPNRRYISQGLYLPALESHDLGEIAIMVDTSGSVDGTSLQYARGIVEKVLDECSPAAVTVYYADAAVKRIDRFEKGEPLTWQPEGGGGTDFCPALEAIEKDGTPVCIVCITDLEGTFPEQAPGIPVIWLATKDHIAPFGETVRLEQ